AFVLPLAPAGHYELTIDGAPSRYSFASYGINASPALSNANAIRAGDRVTATWTASDPDSPDAKVTVGAVLTSSVAGDGSVDLGNMLVLTEGLALGNGSFVWDLTQVPTGDYRLVVSVDDGRHPAVYRLAGSAIVVVDIRPPKVPSGLVADSL